MIKRSRSSSLNDLLVCSAAYAYGQSHTTSASNAYGSQPYAPGVNGADVTGQLDYLMSNIRTNMEYFGGSFDDFCAITDAGSAARYFCNYYERGSGTSVRAANAVTALAWIQQE